MQVVGRGPESVYVYYLKHYQQYREQYYWPCKIGMSHHSALQRIQRQVKTALPENPEVGLIVHTDRAYELEQALHAILRFKGRQIKSPGTEWFDTTPDEVLLLCQLLRAY